MVNEKKVLDALKKYNALRDDLVLEYDLKTGDKRGNIKKNLAEYLAIDVWFIEQQDRLDADFLRAISEAEE